MKKYLKDPIPNPPENNTLITIPEFTPTYLGSLFNNLPKN